jgi:predicted DNA-binding protein
MDMRIPLTVREIIEKPMEEFNDLLTRKDITEEQINICRDIRRRGKNKVRKQNCS